MNLGDNPAVTVAIITLLLTILGFLWKFNNNVIRSQVALTEVVDKVEVHDHKIEKQGNKISELIGAANAKARAAERLDPLSY